MFPHVEAIWSPWTRRYWFESYWGPNVDADLEASASHIHTGQFFGQYRVAGCGGVLGAGLLCLLVTTF